MSLCYLTNFCKIRLATFCSVENLKCNSGKEPYLEAYYRMNRSKEVIRIKKIITIKQQPFSICSMHAFVVMVFQFFSCFNFFLVKLNTNVR